MLTCVWAMGLSEGAQSIQIVLVKRKHRGVMTQNHLMKSQQLAYDTVQITMRLC